MSAAIDKAMALAAEGAHRKLTREELAHIAVEIIKELSK